MSHLGTNPFGNKMPNKSQMTQQLKQMLSQVKNSGNPQQAIQMLCQRNPKFSQFLSTVQNPQQVVTQMMNKAGIDINEIINGL